jgi:hypothetical protein
MDGLIVAIGFGLLAVVLLAVVVAWWEHRKRTIDIQRRLTWSEKSHSALKQQAEAGEARKAAVTGALQQARKHDGDVAVAPEAAAPVRPAPPATPVAPAPHEALETPTLDRFEGPGWAETEPLDGMGAEPQFAETMPADLQFAETLPAELHFAETLPAELSLEGPPPSAGSTRQPA